jgi:hypothetical protein
MRRSPADPTQYMNPGEEWFGTVSLMTGTRRPATASADERLYYRDARVELFGADCRELLRLLPAASVGRRHRTITKVTGSVTLADVDRPRSRSRRR